jgi:hypothetical protein
VGFDDLDIFVTIAFEKVEDPGGGDVRNGHDGQGQYQWENQGSG